MSATTLFWTGFGLTAVAIVGFGIAICRAAGLADEQVQRALRQERAARAGLYPRGSIQASPQEGHGGADTPRAPDISSQARGATTSRGRRTR